jgi:hypothetical protein
VVSPTYTPDAIALIQSITGTNEKKIDKTMTIRMTNKAIPSAPPAILFTPSTNFLFLQEYHIAKRF